MWNFIFAEPLYLMALFLNSQEVLLGLAIISLIIAAYIFYKKRSYQADEKRMLQKTGLNKSVGFMAAVAFVLIVMSWTSKSQHYDLFSGGLEAEDITELEVPPTFQEVELPPEVEFDPPKLESPEIEITEEPEPAPDPEEKKSTEGTETGTGTSTAGPQGPVLPPAPKVKLPIKKEEPKEIVNRFEVFAEQMPRFADNKCEGLKGNNDESIEAKKACADHALAVYLAKTVNYPAMAKEAGFEGIVYVRFIVELDGSISNIEVIKDNTPGGGLKEAALKAVKNMAKKKEWVPGKQGGKKVRVRMVIPINFKLKG